MNRKAASGVLPTLLVLGLCTVLTVQAKSQTRHPAKSKDYRFDTVDYPGTGCSFIWDFNTAGKTVLGDFRTTSEDAVATGFDETIHVPLVIKLSHDAAAGTRIFDRVELADIVPTLLGSASIAVPGKGTRAIASRVYAAGYSRRQCGCQDLAGSWRLFSGRLWPHRLCLERRGVLADGKILVYSGAPPRTL
jgi:hypothetical protein